MRVDGVRHCGHLDPATQLDPARRPDAGGGVSRWWAQAPRGSLPVRRGPTLDRPPSNFYVRYITVDGHMTTVVNDSNAEPVLPSNNDVGRDPITVGSVDKSAVHWRVVRYGARSAGHRRLRPFRHSANSPGRAAMQRIVRGALRLPKSDSTICRLDFRLHRLLTTVCGCLGTGNNSSGPAGAGGIQPASA